jgi:hypothetical protein
MKDDTGQQWLFQAGNSPFEGERALFLDRNIFTEPIEITTLFGTANFCDPRDRKKLSLRNIVSAGFNRLVFANPYGSSDSKTLYDACRKERFPILVCERGLLPGTVMLDRSGFLADSSLFEPDLIVRARPALPHQTLAELRKRYLEKPALERQMSESADLATLESVLQSGASAARPKVLIALQHSQDTAVRFFHSQGRGYETFLRFAQSLCEKYASVCDFTFKPHPREPHATVGGARPVGHLHIADAIIEASHVFCFSSGVGLLAMLLERPVGHFGVPPYHQCAAVHAVRSSGEFDRFLQTGFDPHRESATDYLNYVDAVYSQVDFYGRSINRISNRDIYARYHQVRIASDNGAFDRRPVKGGLLNPARTWPLRALSRSVRNRLKLGYYSFRNT